MDAAILDRVNAQVKEREVLYFPGDCKNIFFIEGNHDTGARKMASEFRCWKQLAEVRIDGQLIVLCLYAMRVGHVSRILAY
jgi:calcineurin-like phosphoesterase family protein